jgi:hypothetical protein
MNPSYRPGDAIHFGFSRGVSALASDDLVPLIDQNPSPEALVSRPAKRRRYAAALRVPSNPVSGRHTSRVTCHSSVSDRSLCSRSSGAFFPVRRLQQSPLRDHPYAGCQGPLALARARHPNMKRRIPPYPRSNDAPDGEVVHEPGRSRWRSEGQFNPVLGIRPLHSDPLLSSDHYCALSKLRRFASRAFPGTQSTPSGQKGGQPCCRDGRPAGVGRRGAQQRSRPIVPSDVLA